MFAIFGLNCLAEKAVSVEKYKDGTLSKYNTLISQFNMLNGFAGKWF